MSKLELFGNSDQANVRCALSVSFLTLSYNHLNRLLSSDDPVRISFAAHSLLT